VHAAGMLPRRHQETPAAGVSVGRAELVGRVPRAQIRGRSGGALHRAARRALHLPRAVSRKAELVEAQVVPVVPVVQVGERAGR